MKLSVVLLSYNTRDLTEQALRSTFAALDGIESEVFVVDNASKDGSAEMVKEKFPNVQLLVNEENIGFSGGNNKALSKVCGNYVLLINTDTIVHRDAFKKLVEFLDAHPQAGAVGCKILNPDGTLQLDSRRGFPTPFAAFCKMSGLSRLFPKHKKIAHYNMTFLDPDEEAEVDVLSGSCMLVRKEAMDQVGLLDEDYFMYGEDIDWCYRIREAGWKIYYTPNAQIIHFRGESGRTVPLRILYRKSKAMSIFVGKHMVRRYRFFPMWILHFAISIYGVVRFTANMLRLLLVPLIDVTLILFGIKMGLTLRYHPELIPLIGQIEGVAHRLSINVEPTRWLELPPYSEIQWAMVYLVSATVWMATFWVLGLYGVRRLSSLWAFVAVSIGFALIMTLVFFFKAYNFSRLAASGAWGCNIFLLCGWRFFVNWLGSKREFSGTRDRAILVGSDDCAGRFLDHWNAKGYLNRDLLAVVLEKEEKTSLLAGRPVMGNYTDLENLIENLQIDTVIFVPGTLGLALEHLSHRWGKPDLRICMIPFSFGESAEKGSGLKSWEGNLVDITLEK